MLSADAPEGIRIWSHRVIATVFARFQFRLYRLLLAKLVPLAVLPLFILRFGIADRTAVRLLIFASIWIMIIAARAGSVVAFARPGGLVTNQVARSGS
jgi:hypothetical protein